MTPTDIRDTAIPEDVMEAAHLALKDCPTVSWMLSGQPQLGVAWRDHDAIQACARAIMAAKEAERERCAKIARSFQPPSFLNLNDRGIAIAIRDDIAAAIRAGTKGETP